MQKPQMILVAGVNGSGKSTLTKSLVEARNIKVIDPDQIAKEITGSFANVDTEQVSSGKKALSLIHLYIKQGRSFIVESTIAGKTYLRYLREAKENGFEIYFVYVALESAEMSAQRVSQRVSNGGHNIPTQDIKRRYPKSLENIRNHAQYCDKGTVYNNSKNYQIVAKYQNGVLSSFSGAPDWLLPYL